MKNLKLIAIIFILIAGAQFVYAGDTLVDSTSMDYMKNSDMDSVVDIENNDINRIFDDKSTKVIRTKKRGFWKGLNFGIKKKNDNDAIKPVVIDYDYDTEKEEIIPVIQETKTEEQIIVKEEKTKDTKKKSKKKKDDNIDYSAVDVNIYCDDMTYDDEKHEITGTGNAKVVLSENNAYMTAKKIIYNYDLNYFEGIDDVKIVRDGVVLEGDYTKVDLNYGNALIDNPVIDNLLVKISAKSGKATSDSIEAYDGIANINYDFERPVYSSEQAYLFQMDTAPEMLKKFYPKEYRNRKTKYHIKTKELYVNSSDGHDTVTLKNADVYIGKVLLLRGTDLKLSTDKTQSYVETTLPEIGSRRYVGAYLGPGFVFNIPGSSTLKLAPVISYGNSRVGVGFISRLRNKGNLTELMYTTSENQFVLKGRQKLGDSDFQIEYSHLSYANDWYFGSGLSKNLVQLAYQKRYIMPDSGTTFAHRATAGYLTDENGNTGTARFRYQAMFTQRLATYENYDKKMLAYLDLAAQGMMGLYGTGDSLGVFRIGPTLTTQYRGWRQQVAYFQSGVGGRSPLKYTDDYRYGHSTVNIVESLRLNKYISLSYFAVLNLSNDDYYNKKNMIAESRVAISLGPDDAKISLGYDMIRQGARLNYSALVGSKNQDISFKKLFIRNPDKIGKGDKSKSKKKEIEEPEIVKEVKEENQVQEDLDFENTIESPGVLTY